MQSKSNSTPGWTGAGAKVAVAMACAAVAQFSATGAAAQEVTFTRDVAPILQQNCQECHQPNSIGPMSLISYDEVRPWAQIIKIRVEEREMPPYHYDTDIGIQELQHDRRLSVEEINTISTWVDNGMPQGNPADMPPSPEFPAAGQWQMAKMYGEPDLIVASTPYTVEAGGQDRWWQPTVETGLNENRCIKAIETKPTVAGRAITHHANSTLSVPGAGRESGSRLSEYALGKLGEIIPSDACRLIRSGSQVTWDVHYFPGWAEEDVIDDQVEVGVWFHERGAETQDLYEQDLTLYFLQGQGGDYAIAPHGTMMTQGFHSFDHPVRIDSFQPHGHLRLAGMKMEAFYPATGRTEVLSQISNWHPGWQISHVYEEDHAPLLPAGAVLILTGYYDNTTDNPHNPDPDQWVGSGDRTSDEMSHAWIAVTHLDQEGYESMLAEREARDEAESLANDN